jgi:hypothetical protein
VSDSRTACDPPAAACSWVPAPYAITNFALKAVNFLLITVFTRYLSPHDYGTISLEEIIATTLLALFSGLGLDTAVRRLYFHYADEPSVQRQYVSSVLRFGAILTVAVVALAFALSGLANDQRHVTNDCCPKRPRTTCACSGSSSGQSSDSA